MIGIPLMWRSSGEPEKPKEIISVKVLPVEDWWASPPSCISTQKCADDKGNEYDIISPTHQVFSWRTFTHSIKFKFNIGERYLAEISRIYEKKSYNGAIGSVNLIKISSLGRRIWL